MLQQLVNEFSDSLLVKHVSLDFVLHVRILNLGIIYPKKKIGDNYYFFEKTYYNYLNTATVMECLL